jgi:hypothetical protein
MRHTTTVLLLAAALALAGCSNSSSGSDKPAKPKASPTVSKESSFLKVAHGITFNGSPTDTELLALPPKWCDALDAAHSVKWMFDSTGGGGLYPWGAEWGTAQQDADTLVVAGVKAYCPRNLKAVADELRASGEY